MGRTVTVRVCGEPPGACHPFQPTTHPLSVPPGAPPAEGQGRAQRSHHDHPGRHGQQPKDTRPSLADAGVMYGFPKIVFRVFGQCR